LRIVLFKESGVPPSVPLEAKFSEQGGTIGRGADCTLVLPDPFRHVSRVQAEITFQADQWVLTDRGSVNSFARGGLEFGRNKQTVLNDQDLLTLGEYELRVDFFDSPAELSATTYSTDTVPASTFWSGIAAKPDTSSHPFQDLFPNTNGGGSANAASGLQPTNNSSKKTIPDDFDIFAPASGSVAQERESFDKLGQVLPSSADQTNTTGYEGAKNGNIVDNDSLDKLFSLRPEHPNSHTVQGEAIDDPLAGYKVDNASLDAFGLSSAPPLAVANVQQRQDSPELNTPFILPNAAFAEPVSSEDELRAIANTAIDQHQARVAPKLEEPFTATLAGLNRQTSETVRKDVIARGYGERRVTQPNKADSKIEPSISPKLKGPTTTVPKQDLAAKQPPESVVMSDEQFELLKQLLIGIGLSELPKSQATGVQAPSALTPELMFRLGQLIKISTNGILEMLEARNLLKREMKAEVTMILKGGNNPLKFSPDALGAAAHLLSPNGVRGFMQPVEALQDAFDDLLAHQVGFVAGMRAATEALIQRFDPKLLEARLEKKSLVETMIPSKRKSKLWERYEELFGEIKIEAEDDFEALFGREFVNAYEAQVEQIKQQRQERS
jgi:FHA domain-containing protein